MNTLQNRRPRPLIHVDVPAQTLTLWLGIRVLREYAISTSTRGTGCAHGSLRTPTGVFRVWRKIGHHAPARMTFRGRRPTGQLGGADDPADLVLTRILWLDGLERRNRNTRARYIYIHGTNHEETIGLPASHGCVRMRNSDVRELFDLVPTGAAVFISDHARRPHP